MSNVIERFFSRVCRFAFAANTLRDECCADLVHSAPLAAERLLHSEKHLHQGQLQALDGSVPVPFISSIGEVAERLIAPVLKTGKG